MRIAIVGAYGSGKTTLAAAIRSTWRVDSRPLEPMRGPSAAPLRPATECSADELAELLVRRLIDRCRQEVCAPDVVSDGSLLHDWAFARTLALHSACPPDGAEAVVEAGPAPFEAVLRAVRARFAGWYDHVFYLPVEFSLNELSPPVSEGFRRLSDGYLLAELESLGVPVLVVMGTLPERVEQVSRVVAASRTRVGVGAGPA